MTKVYVPNETVRDIVRAYWLPLRATSPAQAIVSCSMAEKLEAISAAVGFVVTQWRAVPGGNWYYDTEDALLDDMG